MKKVIINALIFLVIILISSCMDDLDTRHLIVSNKSEKSIYAIISND